MGWNLLEPSGVPEDSAGGFGIRNHITGYWVQGTQWLEKLTAIKRPVLFSIMVLRSN